uniref:(Fe-S)-binding protein n=1 Tax=Desulfobacca acetoxidans TaxID=60893 RepID=A0A7V4LCS2_9BACT
MSPPGRTSLDLGLLRKRCRLNPKMLYLFDFFAENRKPKTDNLNKWVGGGPWDCGRRGGSALGAGRPSRVQLFIPCFMDQFFPLAAEKVVEVLGRLGVACRYPEAQTCCGQFALTAGDEETGRRLAGHFIKVFQGDDPIVCPSASCTLTVRRDYPRLARNAAERRALLGVSARILEFSELVAALGPLAWEPRRDATLVLHRSCKARELGVLPAAEQVLAQVRDLKLVQVSPYYSCCGFGGFFSVMQPHLAAVIGTAYLEAAAAAGAQGLVSLDMSCFLHLEPLARQAGLTCLHLAEVL